jgi:hypothetical protein
MQSVAFFNCYDKCCCTECRYAECRGAESKKIKIQDNRRVSASSFLTKLAPFCKEIIVFFSSRMRQPDVA